MTAVAKPKRDPKVEPLTEDHKPHELRRAQDMEWEMLRYPGQWSKMLFHPRPERPTEPNAGLILSVQYTGPTTGKGPIYDGRFNVSERKPLAEERYDE
ncbi:MAG: hypothetical protein L6R19_01180 [Alphaproteobacteria bacterium]|nr:hypothetical protein [Alphaproteobacteria bacterium]